MRIVFRAFDTICKQYSNIENLKRLETLEQFDSNNDEEKLQILQSVVDGVKEFKVSEVKEKDQLEFDRSEISRYPTDLENPKGWSMMTNA